MKISTIELESFGFVKNHLTNCYIKPIAGCSHMYIVLDCITLKWFIAHGADAFIPLNNINTPHKAMTLCLALAGTRSRYAAERKAEIKSSLEAAQLQLLAASSEHDTAHTKMKETQNIITSLQRAIDILTDAIDFL